MNYIIVSSEYSEYVDFSKVKQTSLDSLRYSLDGERFLLKYEGDQPDFVFNITQDTLGSPEYTHRQIAQILRGPEWTKQDSK